MKKEQTSGLDCVESKPASSRTNGGDQERSKSSPALLRPRLLAKSICLATITSFLAIQLASALQFEYAGVAAGYPNVHMDMYLTAVGAGFAVSGTVYFGNNTYNMVSGGTFSAAGGLAAVILDCPFCSLVAMVPVGGGLTPGSVLGNPASTLTVAVGGGVPYPLACPSSVGYLGPMVFDLALVGGPSLSPASVPQQHPYVPPTRPSPPSSPTTFTGVGSFGYTVFYPQLTWQPNGDWTGTIDVKQAAPGTDGLVTNFVLTVTGVLNPGTDPIIKLGLSGAPPSPPCFDFSYPLPPSPECDIRFCYGTTNCINGHLLQVNSGFGICDQLFSAFAP
jgi:hypothetical protein